VNPQHLEQMIETVVAETIPSYEKNMHRSAADATLNGKVISTQAIQKNDDKYGDPSA
jgi:hypothetical protein